MDIYRYLWVSVDMPSAFIYGYLWISKLKYKYTFVWKYFIYMYIYIDISGYLWKTNGWKSVDMSGGLCIEIHM